MPVMTNPSRCRILTDGKWAARTARGTQRTAPVLRGRFRARYWIDMITAYARAALDVDYTDVPARDRDIAAFEHVTLTGEGETWEEAQQACPIPDGAVVMYWSRWPI